MRSQKQTKVDMSAHTGTYSLRDPKVAMMTTLLVAAAVWGLSKVALSTVFDFSVTSHFRKNQIDTFRDSNMIQLDMENGAYLSSKEYVSNVVDRAFGFNAVALKLNETIPARTGIDLYVRAGTDDEWTDWMQIEREIDGFYSEQSSVYTELIPFSTHNSLQYRALLYTEDPTVTPVLNDVEIISINSKGYWTSVLAPIKIGFIPHVSADGFALNIISRKAWGANEDVRLWRPDIPAPQLVKVDPEEVNTYAHENPIVRRVTHDERGRALTWPLEYPDKVDKIIIHHTAKELPKTDRDALSYVRALYLYHAQTKAWGDVGYNYMIDPFGRVYEGRYGGSGVVGAHAGADNRGSVGIALMGNYQSEEVSPAQLRSLIQLTRALTQQHGIDPLGVSSFRGKILPNIVGHRDVRDTACPGENLYEFLPSIRRDVAGSGTVTLDALLETPEFIEKIDSEPIPIPIIAPVMDAVPDAIALRNLSYTASASAGAPRSAGAQAGQRDTVKLQFENQGDVVWNARTNIYSRLQYPGLEVGDSDSRVYMTEQTVAPGERGTFEVPVYSSVPNGRRYVLEFELLVNGFAEGLDTPYRLTLDVAPGVVDSEVTEVGLDAEHQLVSTEGQDGSQQFAGVPRSTVSAAWNQGTVESATTLQQIRVKIDMAGDEISITGDGQYAVYADDAKVATLEAGEQSRVNKVGDTTTVVTGGNTYTVSGPVRFNPLGETIMSVTNMNRVLPWAPEHNDNRFRGTLEVRVMDDTLGVINELPLEQYLRGVAEVSETTHYEKMKTMSVLARSYAYFYMTRAEKFPGAPYHLDDLPSNSQKYRGFGFEQRVPEWVAAVAETRGEVVKYQGHVAKTPYFHSSNGRTLSAEEKWGWTDASYLQSVADPLCAGTEFAGHGVGLSGCGAQVAAERGYTYLDIIHYYYTGVTVEPAY